VGEVGTVDAVGASARDTTGAIVAELGSLGLIVSGEGGPALDPRVREIARFVSTDVTPEALALIAKAIELRHLARAEAAIDALTRALAILDDGATRERALVLRLLGLARLDGGDLEGSVEAHTKAEYMLGATGDGAVRMRERCSLGDLRLEQGRLSEAHHIFVGVLEARGGDADLSATLLAQTGLVEIRARRGDTSDAVDTLLAAARTARDDGLVETEAACLSTLAIVHGVLGDAAKSVETYHAAVELWRSLRAHRRTAILHALIGEQHALRGDADQALACAGTAEAVLGADRDPGIRATAAIARGAALEVTGDLTGALAAYWEAVEAARRSGATYAEHRACVLSAQLDPDQDRAARYLRRALLSLAAESDRGPFLQRPALAAWLSDRLEAFGLPAPQRSGVREILVVPATAETAGVRDGRLQVSLLGTLDVRIGGTRISDRAWRTSKAKELFSLLLLHRDRVLRRDEIIERLWPECEPGSGVSNFHFTLHALRKALASVPCEGGPTVSADGGYQLVTSERAPVDVDVFELLLLEGQRARRALRAEDTVRLLRAATALYRGDLLEGLDTEWVTERREEFLRQQLSALRQLADLELERGDVAAAAHAANRYLDREPYDEQVHRLLMRAYHAAGDRALVERHYRSVCALLRRDLGSEPERESRQLYERLCGKSPLSPVVALAQRAR